MNLELLAIFYVLWDFNGTLLNDVEAGIKSVNVLLKRRNLPIIESVEHYRKLFGFPIIDYYRRVGFDFDSEDYADIAVEWVEQYIINSQSSKLYDNVIHTLGYFQKIGAVQLVLSATEINMLVSQLENLGILSYFNDILGLDNIHAYSKIKLAVDWAECIHPSRAVLIGDTEHDYETAKAAKFECVLVSNGHRSKSDLLKCGVPVADDIAQVINII